MRTGPFKEWDRATRLPNPPPPPGSCDCQFHIYGDPQKYPPSAAATYPPIDATFEHAVAMHAALGFTRGVIVHSSIYGSDHRLLLDTLERASPELRRRYRATSIIDDSVSDRELERLNAAGVCAARLNIAKMFGVTPSKGATLRTIDRIRELGWHVRVHVRGNDLLEFSDVLKGVRDIPMVIDHMGHVDLSKGLDDPVCQWILEILKRENWWMMVSNGNRDSKMESGLGRCGSGGPRLCRGRARPHHLVNRLAASDVVQADDERRRRSRAALSLCRQRPVVAAADPGRQSGTASPVRMTQSVRFMNSSGVPSSRITTPTIDPQPA